MSQLNLGFDTRRFASLLNQLRGRTVVPMEFTGVGGGLMLAVAAALWMIYLIPNWLKRREYLATERNAVRLQQTIRVLSETAEAPEELAAPIRAVPMARAAPRNHAAPMGQGAPMAPSNSTAPAAPVRQRAMPAPAPRVTVAPDRAVPLATRRLRRTRAVTALVLLASIVAAVVQVVLMITTGAVAGGWLVLGVSTIAAAGSVALLGRLAGVSRARSAAGVAPRAARTVRMSEPVESPVAEPQREWTPVRVPKPVYLSKPVVAPSTMADPAVRVAAEAERAQRPPEREVAALDQRLAAMGIVDVPAEAPAPLHDLDAVLARRRAAG